MSEEVANQVAGLHHKTRQELLELWQKLYGKPAPGELRREFLVSFLAYRIQEQAYGGLKLKIRTELRRIAREFEKPTKTVKPRPRTRMKVGTRLFREWHGKTHEVFVTGAGFEYHGSCYPSLSQIARRITGTPWSGPAFFGLKNTHSSERQAL